MQIGLMPKGLFGEKDRMFSLLTRDIKEFIDTPPDEDLQSPAIWDKGFVCLLISSRDLPLVSTIFCISVRDIRVVFFLPCQTKKKTMSRRDTIVEQYRHEGEHEGGLDRVVMISIDPSSAEYILDWAMENFIRPDKDLVSHCKWRNGF